MVLEGFHAGTVPDSHRGDFSDVVVKTPYGWRRPQVQASDDLHPPTEASHVSIAALMRAASETCCAALAASPSPAERISPLHPIQLAPTAPRVFHLDHERRLPERLQASGEQLVFGFALQKFGPRSFAPGANDGGSGTSGIP
jgi:hypothetical protein